MTETGRDIFLKQFPWGFKKESGYWEINLGIPENYSIASLNDLTMKMVISYLKGFCYLCRPVEVRYDLMSFDQNGKLKSIQEGKVKRIEQQEDSRLIDELKQIIANPSESFFYALFLECDLQVLLPSPGSSDSHNWIPRAGKFYIGYVEPDDEDRLIPVDSSLSFDTTIDIWVAKTQNSVTSEWQNNQACAEQNQPLLEAALRAWESLVGRPIVEWGSRYYRNQVFKYGFRESSQVIS
jgi:hypothetical protein